MAGFCAGSESGTLCGQPVPLIAFAAMVTAPVRARALPRTVAPVFSVMLAWAMMLPTKAVVVPSVADEPTCQNTLQSEPPLMRVTAEALAVVSVLPIWKMNTAFGLPAALSVRVPVRPAEVEKQ